MSTSLFNHKQIREVSSFDDLVHLPFQGDVNASFWNRKLEGDFEELVSKLHLKENITEVSIADLQALELSENGQKAREIVLQDLQLLSNFGALPTLNLLKCYDLDDEFDFISTDVYSFHVDRSPVATDTYLCTYYGASSDILSNEDAIQKIQIPEVRKQLKNLFDGSEADFEAFLEEYFFDLHYQAKPNAQPINLGTGLLWRLAVDHPNQQVLPCVHRAPIENDGEYRLLLIC